MRLNYSLTNWKNSSQRWIVSYGAAFWLLLLLAAALRFYALDFGLPCYTRPDEEAVLAQVASLWYAPRAGLTFTFFLYYPTLFAHTLGLYWFPRYLLAKAALPGLTYFGFLTSDAIQPAVHLSERLLSAACGVLVAFPLFRLGMMARGRRTALFAVALWAVAYIPVRDAHFGVVDQLAALSATWALLACIEYHQKRTASAAILAGVCVGWAIASKYVFACGLLMLVAHFWNCPPEQRWGRVARMLLIACGVAIVALTPEFAVRPWAFLHILGAQRIWNRTYANLLPIGWIYFWQFSLRYGMGLPVTLAALIGSVAAIRQRHRPLQLALCLCGLYYLFAGGQHGIFSRHLNPILPGVCLLAAFGVSAVYRAAESRWKANGAMLVAGSLALLCLGWNLKNSLELLRVLPQEDTRVLALRWLKQNVPPGKQTAVCGLFLGYPDSLPLQVAQVTTLNQMDLKTIRHNGAAYVMTVEYVPQMPMVTPPALLRELQSDPQCRRLAVFTPFAEDSPRSSLIVEFQDAWFLPFADVSEVRKPGPLLTIYQVQ